MLQEWSRAAGRGTMRQEERARERESEASVAVVPKGHSMWLAPPRKL